MAEDEWAYQQAAYSKRPKSAPCDSEYSAIERRQLDGDPGSPYAFIAPTECAQERAALPTVLAISGEEQLHVSMFFRAWRAEDRCWQVVVPLRRRSGLPYLFEKAGVDFIVELMRRLLTDTSCQLMPYPARGRKFHLVGTSNGGAAVLAVAARAPDLVASLTLVTGFCPEELGDLSPVRAVPAIRLYAGDRDELGHDEALAAVKERLALVGASAELFILKGARHGNVGHYIDMNEFWRFLLAAQRAAEGEALGRGPGGGWRRRRSSSDGAGQAAAGGRAGPAGGRKGEEAFSRTCALVLAGASEATA